MEEWTKLVELSVELSIHAACCCAADCRRGGCVGLRFAVCRRGSSRRSECCGMLEW